MARTLAHRWIVFQFGGSHAENSLEDTLHQGGGDFLHGVHTLDDPDAIPWTEEAIRLRRTRREDRDAAAALDLPTLAKYGYAPGDESPPRPAWRQTKKPGLPPAPPPWGGYPALSWCYVNDWSIAPAAPYLDVCRRILDADPACRLLLWMRYAHVDLPDVIAELQAGYRLRHVSLLHRVNFAEDQAEGGGPDRVAALDDLAGLVDFLYFSGCGLTAKGTGAFRRRHGLTGPRTIRTLHSKVTALDLAAMLGRAEDRLAELSPAP